LPNKELDRMRAQCPVECVWPFLHTEFVRGVTYRLNIMFHNTVSFSRHSAAIAADYGFKQADIIFLCEARTNPLRRVEMERLIETQMPDFKLVYVSGSTETNAAHGQMCIVRKSKSMRLNLMSHNCSGGPSLRYTNSTTKCCELSLFRYEMIEGNQMSYVFLLHVYKHPAMGGSDFLRELFGFITSELTNRRSEHKKGDRFTCDKRLIIIGDMNLDARRTQDTSYDQLKYVNRLIAELDMSWSFSIEQFRWTTCRRTLIDWCLFNANIRPDQIDSQVYASVYSDHMPIWCSYTHN
jgi:hypothetical protein